MVTEEFCDKYLTCLKLGDVVKTWKWRDIYFFYTSSGYRSLTTFLILAHMLFCVWEVGRAWCWG